MAAAVAGRFKCEFRRSGGEVRVAAEDSDCDSSYRSVREGSEVFWREVRRRFDGR